MGGQGAREHHLGRKIIKNKHIFLSFRGLVSFRVVLFCSFGGGWFVVFSSREVFVVGSWLFCLVGFSFLFVCCFSNGGWRKEQNAGPD